LSYGFCALDRAVAGVSLVVGLYHQVPVGMVPGVTDFESSAPDPGEDQEVAAALVAEFKRVAPSAPDDMFLGPPPNLEEALAAIRRLPDGAGLVAIARAWGYPDVTVRALKKELGA
jgi:hypothetical protein